jgi:hypothetical protein
MKKLPEISAFFMAFFCCMLAINGNAQIITTVFGNGTQGFTGDGGPALSAELNLPMQTAFDGAGNVYILDGSNNRVRKVNTAGIISTVAGTGVRGSTGDGGLATSANLYLAFVSFAVDPAGNIYLPDSNCIRMVNTSGIISTIAGIRTPGFSGDGGLATAAKMKVPHGIALDAAGNIYFSDANRIRMINTSGIINTIVGTGTAGFAGDGALAINAQISSPGGVAIDAAGNLYFNDQGNARMRMVNTSGIISTIAGTGTAGTTGDGGLATAAQINTPNYDIALDTHGNLYFPDNNRLRMINTSGIISTVAGTGGGGFTGDGGPPTAATFQNLIGVAVDVHGKIYITDNVNNRVRMVCNVPTIAPSPTTYTICNGSSQTFSVSGASSYTWTPAATLTGTNTANPVASPTTTTTYSVIGMDTAGCTNHVASTVTLTVKALPAVVINATPSASVCAASSLSLTISGSATSYTWDNGATTSLIVVSPTVSTTYSVTGTAANGCTKTATKNITIYALPTLNVNAPTICTAGTTTLTVSGATTYTWNTGATTASITSTPSVTTIYTVSGTGLHACKNTITTTVTIDVPVITVNSPTICIGDTAYITANGATTYTWNTTDMGATIKPTPSTATMYTVTGTDTYSCTNAATATVNVNTLPVVTISSGTAAICAGSTIPLTANGAATYSWSTTETTTVITPSPTITTNYSVTGTDMNNCINTATATINVNALPVITITNSVTTSCGVNAIPLTASGAATYSWSTTETTAAITPSPSVTTSYTVDGTDLNGCVNTATAIINVNPLPSVTFDMNPNSYCTTDAAVTLNASPAGGTYTGTAVSTGQFDPATAGVGTYTLSYMYTDANSCINTDTAVVAVQNCGVDVRAFTKGNISIYPNPATAIFYIQTNTAFENSVVELYDVLGKKVISEKLSGNLSSLSLGNLGSGVYQVRVLSDNALIYQSKLVKQ